MSSTFHRNKAAYPIIVRMRCVVGGIETDLLTKNKMMSILLVRSWMNAPPILPT
jgi:hypothetical protein